MTVYTTISLSAQPSTGFWFHKQNDETCTDAAYYPRDVNIGVGANNVSIHFIATTASVYTVTATCPGYTPATQQQIVQ